MALQSDRPNLEQAAAPAASPDRLAAEWQLLRGVGHGANDTLEHLPQSWPEIGAAALAVSVIAFKVGAWTYARPANFLLQNKVMDAAAIINGLQLIAKSGYLAVDTAIHPERAGDNAKVAESLGGELLADGALLTAGYFGARIGRDYYSSYRLQGLTRDAQAETGANFVLRIQDGLLGTPRFRREPMTGTLGQFFKAHEASVGQLLENDHGGTAFYVDHEHGLWMTNHHAVAEHGPKTIRFKGQNLDAEVRSIDPNSDAAIVQTKPVSEAKQAILASTYDGARRNLILIGHHLLGKRPMIARHTLSEFKFRVGNAEPTHYFRQTRASESSFGAASGSPLFDETDGTVASMLKWRETLNRTSVSVSAEHLSPFLQATRAHLRGPNADKVLKIDSYVHASPGSTADELLHRPVEIGSSSLISAADVPAARVRVVTAPEQIRPGIFWRKAFQTSAFAQLPTSMIFSASYLDSLIHTRQNPSHADQL